MYPIFSHAWDRMSRHSIEGVVLMTYLRLLCKTTTLEAIRCVALNEYTEDTYDRRGLGVILFMGPRVQRTFEIHSSIARVGVPSVLHFGS